jgi:hypothetical protein
MPPLSRREPRISYCKFGLMCLKDHFEQRKVGARPSSSRSLIPLITPSGPQWAESKLESELLEQLAFTPGIYDLMTQPVIQYLHNGKKRRYTPDIAVQLYGGMAGFRGRYLIEVKRKADLIAKADKYASKFEIAQICCEQLGAAFRVMTEDQIRTPYLRNARQYLQFRNIDINDDHVRQLDVIHSILEESPRSVSDLTSALQKKGFLKNDAHSLVSLAIGSLSVSCDLSTPVQETTALSVHRNPGALTRHNTPILFSLLNAATVQTSTAT